MLVPRSSVDRMMLGVVGSMALTVLGVLSYFGWTVLTPMSFFEVKQPEWTLTERSRVLHPGDEVYTSIDACKNTTLPAEIGRMLVGTSPKHDGLQLIILPDVSGAFSPGCRHLNVSVATLPQGILPGTYRVFVVIRYRYSALRTVEHQFRTEQFEVR